MGNFTPGPWRFEYNEKHRSLTLVGGKPRYDLTIMDFCRWGMHGAGIRLRDVAHDGMNIMHDLHKRPDWVAPEAGREHHASWFKRVNHPDLVLIEAAPDLLAALKAAKLELHYCSQQLVSEGWSIGSTVKKALEDAEAAIAKATGEAAKQGGAS